MGAVFTDRVRQQSFAMIPATKRLRQQSKRHLHQLQRYCVFGLPAFAVNRFYLSYRSYSPRISVGRPRARQRYFISHLSSFISHIAAR